MRSIVRYMLRYAAESRHPWLFLTAAVFTGLSLAANYHFTIERSAVDALRGGWMIFPFYCLFFGFPFAAVTAAYSLWYRRWDFWRLPGFIALGVLTVAGLALEASIDIGAGDAPGFIPSGYSYLYSLCMNNVVQAVLWTLPVLAYRYWWDCERPVLYGLTVRGFSIAPYVAAVALLAPGIFWASGGADFLQAYPRYRLAGIPVGWDRLHWLFLFESCYGLAYVCVELFFRGFMVMALYRYLGSGAVPVAATVYCYIHFQKPFLEALTSFFGGYILGIISCYGGSIYGGVIAHLGTAWLMEAAAIWRLWQR